MGNILGSVSDMENQAGQTKDEWVVVQLSGETTIEITSVLTEPEDITTASDAESPSPIASPEQCMERQWMDYPSPVGRSTTLPIIEEEGPEYFNQDEAISPNQPRSPSVDFNPFPELSPSHSLDSRHTPHRSRAGSLDSKCRDKSRTASMESRLSEVLGLEVPTELAETPGSQKGQLPELMGDPGANGQSSPPRTDEKVLYDEFQPSELTVSVLQGSIVESILLETKKAMRDDGLTAAVRYIQTHLERDSTLQVTKSLLHKACTQTTDLYTFSIALMNVDKTMINYQNERLSGRTPLHVACSYLPVEVNERTKWLEEQQVSKITKLLTYHPDCTKQDQDGNTPLHLTTFHNNAKCVSLILKKSPDCVDLGNKLGNTALHIACRDNFVDVVKVLCEHKANARLPNGTKKQRFPLHQAVSKGHSQVVELLLNYDPGLVENTDSKLMLPLHLAIKRDCPIITRSLLSVEQCPVAAVDCEGRTALHYASELGSAELVSMLLKRDNTNEFVNAQDANGDTALHLARRHGNEVVAKLLKAKNASKKITNKQGETPKETAVNAGHSLRSRKGVKKLGGLLKRKKDFIPKIPASDPLVSLDSSQTPPSSIRPGKTN